MGWGTQPFCSPSLVQTAPASRCGDGLGVAVCPALELGQETSENLSWLREMSSFPCAVAGAAERLRQDAEERSRENDRLLFVSRNARAEQQLCRDSGTPSASFEIINVIYSCWRALNCRASILSPACSAFLSCFQSISPGWSCAG